MASASEENSTVQPNQEQQNAQGDTGKVFMILYKKGDLFACPETDSIAHCVSEDLRMGKGIATLFTQKFRGLHELKSQAKGVGSVAVLKRGNRYVYYLITKPKYFHKPTYDTLEQSLQAMKDHCVQNGVTSLSMPKIGCGLDKLEWSTVEKKLIDIFKDADPLPSDLARAEAPVCLDDVVSTELINTDTSHNSMKFNLLNNANEHSDQDVGGLEDPDEVMKSIEANKIKNSTNGQHEYPTECGDNVCDIEGDINVTATLVHSSGSQNVKEADLTAEKHGLKVVENPAGQTCVGEFDVESIDNTGNFTASSNHMSETAVTDSAVEETS